MEVVRITYDASTLSYGALLDFYARHVDPTDGGGRFCDRGPAYRPVIFVMDEQQERAEAKTKLDEIAKLISQPVAVEIADAGPFWPAEDYHQDYAEKNPLRYKYYRWNCGRDQRVAKWAWRRGPPVDCPRLFVERRSYRCCGRFGNITVSSPSKGR